MGWQHGKSVGGLFEKVSNSLLMTDIAYQPSKKSRQHYSKMADCTDQSSNVVFNSLLYYVMLCYNEAANVGNRSYQEYIVGLLFC